MKNQWKDIAAFTFAAVASASLIVACGQQKSAPVKAGSNISIANADQAPAKNAAANDQNILNTTQTPEPRFDVNVTDQKPMIAIIQASMGDQLTTFLNDPKAQGPVQEIIKMDLSLVNLDGTSVLGAAATAGATTPGAGSSLILKTILNNSVDQPIAMTMTSSTAVVIVSKDTSKLSATFTFLPESKMRTDMMTVTLDGSIAKAQLAPGQVFSGNISITDSNNNSVQIGTFSVPVSQIMSDKDAASLQP
jgi:hypothetical protein